MRKKHRVLAFMLAASFMLPVMGCAADSPGTAETTSGETVPAVVTTLPSETTASLTTDSGGDQLDSLPDDLNYGGEVIHILTWDSEEPEFMTEGLTGEVVNDAIYQRNDTVERRLNVDLEFTEEKGSVNYQAGFVSFVQKSLQSGEGEFDIIATYSRTSGTLAIGGYLYDLTGVQYLDFEKPWWPETMLKTQSIGDSLYFVSGDVSTNLIHMLYCIYYNKDMLEKYRLEDPQQLVLDRKWTQDKMIEMSTNIYQDLNNNGQVDVNDQVGMSGIHYHLDAFYTGSGLRLVESDADELLVISPDFGSEKAINMAEKLTAWVGSDDVFVSGYKANTDYQHIQQANGLALFMLNRLYLAKNSLRDADFSYGVLPVPLYDENQENYMSVLSNPYTNYCIIADCDDPDRAGAVIEAWASAAYRTTTPALFEITMKVKYSENDLNAQIYDIIRETACFDLGRIFGENLNYLSDYYNLAILKGTPWASQVKVYSRVLDSKIKIIVDKFNEIKS